MSTWLTSLNAENKRALYIFAITSKSIILSSFISLIQSYTDLATSGAGVTTITSTSGGFQPWMVGYWLVITGGTNFAVGNYKIVTWLSATSVILDSSPTLTGMGSVGTGTIQSVTGADCVLPFLQIPRGASQKIDELNGHSSISTLDVTAIDPSGILKRLSADDTAIGQISVLSIGFPGIDIADFIPIHTGRIVGIGRSSDGVMTIQVNDLLTHLVEDVFLNGGPDAWVLGDPTNPFPLTSPILLDNGIPVSKENPRYISGNPMDILLAVVQNELGLGQTAAPQLYDSTSGGSGTGQAGFGINPSWTMYDGIDPSTLINPNPYLEVADILELKRTQFAGDRMEFTITSSQTGKGWIEDQILKVLGLYWITKANGKLTVKSMKYDASQVIDVELCEMDIIGIPEINRWPVINMIQATVQSNDAKQINFSFVQQTSINKYRTRYVHTVNAEGFRLGLGATARLFLLCNRIFNRHAFGTPEYTIRAFLKDITLELGDFFYLTHHLVLDLKTGYVGIENVLVEIVDRQPDYSVGMITFKAIDTRFTSLPSGAFKIADVNDSIPNWPAATAAQKALFMFISDNQGLQSNADAANQIA